MIDLSSDTATKPTPGMREFMAAAEVGDEQRREDPTVNLLQEMAADLVGKEAGLFLPSGTLCNAISFCLNAERGNGVILDKEAHPVVAESGGPAWLAGVLLRTINSPRGVFDADDVAPHISPGTTHVARTAFVSVENTTNRGGGKIWPLANLKRLRALVDDNGMRLHMDGARLLNATVGSGISAKEFAGYADSVWLDLSKGLGAPVGAVLMGDRAFIERARLLKHMFGGAMRQAGIIAAGGVYALRHHVDRLADDHRNAKTLAAGLAAIPGIKLGYDDFDTNIIFFDITGTGMTPNQLEGAVNARGVRFGANYDFTHLIRAVTHLDVSSADIETTIAAVRESVAEFQNVRA